MDRILIADDEEYIRILMKRAIKSLHYEIVGEASDGNAAIELFRKYQPDIVLLDIDMPLKKGTEVLRLIKIENPNTCVIMLTSHAESDKVQECIKYGAYSYLRKDTPISRIKEILQGAVANIATNQTNREKRD